MSMDKEECVQTLLSTLQKPQWKSSNSVTDWDLKNLLWRAGLLLTPEQAAGLLSEMKRRGLIVGRERRSDSRIVAMWGVRLTPAGEDWLSQRAMARTLAPLGAPSSPPATTADVADQPEPASDLEEPVEATLGQE